MKNNPKKGERKEIEVKGMFSFLKNLWVVILVFMAYRKIYKYGLYYNVINNATI